MTMTKAARLFWILAVALSLSALFSPLPGFARLTGTNPTGASSDAWCVGPSGAEVCVDYQGNVLPTTNNDTTSGTSSLRWADVETVSLNAAGGNAALGTSATTLTAAGNQSLGTIGTASAIGVGNASIGKYASVIGGIVTPSVAFGLSGQTGVFISTTIPVLSSYETIISSGGNIKLTSTPTISTDTVAGGATAIPDGWILVLTSTATQTITFQDEGTLTGSNLALGAATRAISKTKTLTLQWNAALGRWLELAYGNNQGN
jgi:hypothetical protein